MPAASLALALVVLAPEPSASTAPAPAPAPAQPEAEAETEDPEQLAAEAEAAFADGRFEDVVRLASRAYALTGDPRHLYAQALAERRLGHCREALVLYARVLASVQDDPAYSALVDGTRQGITLCDQQLEDEQAPPPEPAPEPEPTPAPTPTEPAVDDRPNPRTQPPRRWYQDPWGGLLLGLGVAAVAGGGPPWALSNAALDDANRANDETVYADARARARGLRIGATVSFAAGGALLTGAIIRYVLVDRALRAPTAGIVPLPSGLALGWQKKF